MPAATMRAHCWGPTADTTASAETVEGVDVGDAEDSEEDGDEVGLARVGVGRALVVRPDPVGAGPDVVHEVSTAAQSATVATVDDGRRCTGSG